MVYPVIGGRDPSEGYDVSNSLRFNDDDSQYMYKTPGSASNQRTWTFSCWFKRSVMGGAMNIWTAGADVQNRCHIDINS